MDGWMDRYYALFCIEKVMKHKRNLYHVALCFTLFLSNRPSISFSSFRVVYKLFLGSREELQWVFVWGFWNVVSDSFQSSFRIIFRSATLIHCFQSSLNAFKGPWRGLINHPGPFHGSFRKSAWPFRTCSLFSRLYLPFKHIMLLLFFSASDRRR